MPLGLAQAQELSQFKNIDSSKYSNMPSKRKGNTCEHSEIKGLVIMLPGLAKAHKMFQLRNIDHFILINLQIY